MMMMRSALF